MTWSLIAQDPATGELAIAVATRFFAAGARVPFVSSGVGGIATQALVNPYYGIDGLQLLRKGHTPDGASVRAHAGESCRCHRPRFNRCCRRVIDGRGMIRLMCRSK